MLGSFKDRRIYRSQDRIGVPFDRQGMFEMKSVLAGLAALTLVSFGPAVAQTVDNGGAAASDRGESNRERLRREMREDLTLRDRSREEQRFLEMKRLRDTGRHSGRSWSPANESAPANAPNRQRGGTSRQSGTVRTQ